MPTLDDVRTLALSFPETVEKVDGHRGGATWRTTAGPFAWERGPSKVDLATLADLGRAWPDGTVLGLSTDDLEAKEALIGAFPDVFFTIPHFDGYAAVLVRLDEITPDLLREVVTDAWLAKAPARLAKAWLAERD